jgi:hypothetical protein
MASEKKHSEFPDWYAFKLEDDKVETLPCIICKAPTSQYVSAIHLVFKKMKMAHCCSDNCFKVYRKKYNV